MHIQTSQYWDQWERFGQGLQVVDEHLLAGQADSRSELGRISTPVLGEQPRGRSETGREPDSGTDKHSVGSKTTMFIGVHAGPSILHSGGSSVPKVAPPGTFAGGLPDRIVRTVEQRTDECPVERPSGAQVVSWKARNDRPLHCFLRP